MVEFGTFLGKKAGTEESNVVRENGSVVRARAIPEFQKVLTLKDYDGDPAGVSRGMQVGRPLQEDLDELQSTSRVQTRREGVEKFAPTSGCKDRAHKFVHHREECRSRMEGLMREDAGFLRHVENADIRMTQKTADVLERSCHDATVSKQNKNTSRTPEGRSATFRVQGFCFFPLFFF